MEASSGRFAGSRLPRLLLLLLLPLLVVVIGYLYGERWLRRLLLNMSAATWARRLVTNMPLTRQVADRFVAGNDKEAALATAAALNDQGLRVTLDFLGESVSTPAEAAAARDEIASLLEDISRLGLDANVSVKLTQLGLDLGDDLAYANVRALLRQARRLNNRVRIDMEDSATVDIALATYRKLRYDDGFTNVGVVIQSYLYRSQADVEELIEQGAWVRLVKGAYAEPPEIAFPEKADTDANFVRLTYMMLGQRARERGVYLGVATHDDSMIRATLDFATANNIPSDSFEFQMLYGIRRDLQRQLVDQGYRVRVYVPYGGAWYPYLMRRLAERPANLWFFMSSLWRN